MLLMALALRKCSDDLILEQFLSARTDPRRPTVNAENIAVVLAHPDDETIGCGAQLVRWQGVAVVIITDGAPRTLSSATLARFGSHENYAAIRSRELLQALSIAGVANSKVVQLAIPDQHAAFRLIELGIGLAEIFATRGIEVAITHAYEGGHPDHDATCFAVHAAAKKMQSRGEGLIVIEMPYYRAGNAGWLVQSFAPSGNEGVIALALSDDEQARKARMLAAHASQQEMLAHFSSSVEYFRVAPAYDFTQLPNDHRLFYEQHDWGMTGKQWRQLAGAALCELNSRAAG
jgi:LmbE family N-acetylglucosaminyl deacetylase